VFKWGEKGSGLRGPGLKKKKNPEIKAPKPEAHVDLHHGLEKEGRGTKMKRGQKKKKKGGNRPPGQ